MTSFQKISISINTPKRPRNLDERMVQTAMDDKTILEDPQSVTTFDMSSPLSNKKVVELVNQQDITMLKQHSFIKLNEGAYESKTRSVLQAGP